MPEQPGVGTSSVQVISARAEYVKPSGYAPDAPNVALRERKLANAGEPMVCGCKWGPTPLR